VFWRGYCTYTYVTCGRCERKVPIEYCEWDDGILVCTIYGCRDSAVVGSIELAQAREVSRDRQELTPDQKLINPVDPSTQIETVPASSGIYD
jgi:hypothetical protein